MNSENGLMIVEIIRHILSNNHEEMPAAYKNLLANKCKPASVRGLLQVLSPEPDLDKICNIENAVYLPRPVAQVILKLLQIRSDTFSGKTKRNNTDFVRWPAAVEHPTQCYPSLPLWRYPSNYSVQSVSSADLCNKAFPNHDAFAAGIYSIGWYPDNK